MHYILTEDDKKAIAAAKVIIDYCNKNKVCAYCDSLPQIDLVSLEMNITTRFISWLHILRVLKIPLLSLYPIYRHQ